MPGAVAPAAHGQVILPQALRIATPPTVGFLVQIIKNTSIALAGDRVFRAGLQRQDPQQLDLPALHLLCCAAILYFAMCYPLSRWSRYLERKPNASRG